MKRIVIIGNSGSGKSTFADKLGKKLNRPIIHLDKEYYNNKWEEKYKIKEDWKNFQRELVKNDTWIIDGNYRSSMEIRLARADTIIFFDFPKWRCLWRVFARILNREQPVDKPEGVKNRLSTDLIRHIIKYSRIEILGKIEHDKNHAQVFVVRNNKEIKNLLYLINEKIPESCT